MARARNTIAFGRRVARMERSAIRETPSARKSPDSTSFHPGYGIPAGCRMNQRRETTMARACNTIAFDGRVARMERSAIRENPSARKAPDSTSFHPGYGISPGCRMNLRQETTMARACNTIAFDSRVARMERSAIRENRSARKSPDSTSFHPGYGVSPGCRLNLR